MKLSTFTGLLAAGLFTVSAQAALYDRGNGMIYDDVLDITWLQDANYAQTSGYDADGRMTWADANTWAGQLSYDGYDDWRLASAGNAPASGYNVTTGELGHMFYNNLGNTAGNSILGNVSFTDATLGGGTESFLNVQSDFYWYGEEYAPGAYHAWAFGTVNGGQGTSGKNYSYYSWAVRAGDVSSVPVPAAAWLFGTALLGLVGVKRRHR
ncbi:MAG: VPLPA-CTERM sorting domain-containing protein [Gammaproteobacteria bacterium]|nr:VPLPA-CTERM sorting domain-containing protein [Gammaproteobacteria bacterium]